MELVDPFGWHKIDLPAAEKVRNRLAAFESMTWAQILIDGKKRHHSISVGKIIKPAQKRLRAIGQHDVESLVSLSVGSLERVWGIMELGVLKVIWWDPKHLICPSKKRGT